MNKIDYRIKGTKIPELPNNIEFKAASWANFRHNEFYFNKIKQSDLISYGYIKHQSQDCILVEDKNYKSNFNYWIFKESDLIKLTGEMNKQNNLPKYWVVKNTNNDDFKVVIDYLNDTYESDYDGNACDCYYGYNGNSGNSGTGTTYFKDLSLFKNNPTVLTLEEFKKAINMEEEFVLPEKWVISRDLNSLENVEVTNWFNKKFNYSYSANQFKNNYYIYPKLQNTNYHNLNYVPPSHTEITFEQFKKYVLKMEDNKKIIGYKLINEKYRKAALKIADINNFLSDLECDFTYDSICAERLKESEVLDLWFKPIYEEEVKTINMGSFNLTVKDKKVFHKNEDITYFVLGIKNLVNPLEGKISKWSCNIKEIIFSETGCENTETKLSDWLKVYDMIK